MDQQTEKLQDSEKKASHKSWSARKKRAILAVIAAALALFSNSCFCMACTCKEAWKR